MNFTSGKYFNTRNALTTLLGHLEVDLIIQF